MRTVIAEAPEIQLGLLAEHCNLFDAVANSRAQGLSSLQRRFGPRQCHADSSFQDASRIAHVLQAVAALR